MGCPPLEQRLTNNKRKAVRCAFSEAESSVQLAKSSYAVQLLQDEGSDPQQRHVDEEVADRGEDVATHLPPQLLRVHLGPQPLDAEHAAPRTARRAAPAAERGVKDLTAMKGEKEGRKRKKEKPHFLERAAIFAPLVVHVKDLVIYLPRAAAPTGDGLALSSCSRSTLRPALRVSFTTRIARPLLSPCTYLCEPRSVLRTLSALSIVSRVRILKAFSSEEAACLPLQSARI